MLIFVASRLPYFTVAGIVAVRFLIFKVSGR